MIAILIGAFITIVGAIGMYITEDGYRYEKFSSIFVFSLGLTITMVAILNVTGVMNWIINLGLAK